MDPKVKILMLKGEKGDPGGATWGNISGTLSNQTDLNTALSGKANTSDLGAVCFTNDYADLSNKPQFSEVAVSGSYTDLTNKPTQLTDFSGILPVSQGGTGAADGAIPRRFTLFSSVEGVEPTTITLSDSYRNYQKIGLVTSIELWGEVENEYGEFGVLPGATVQRYTARVTRIGTGDDNVVFHLMELDFSGTSVTYVDSLKISIGAQGIEPQQNFKSKIHYIYGYKY